MEVNFVVPPISTPGSSVTVPVHIKVPKDMHHVKKIYINSSSEEYMSYTVSNGRDTVSYISNNKKPIAELDLSKWLVHDGTKDSEKMILPKGEYNLDFAFVIPEDCLSTFKINSIWTNWTAHHRVICRVVVERSGWWRRNLRKSCELDILCPINRDDHPPINNHFLLPKLRSTGIINDSQVLLTMQNPVVMGNERVSFTFAVENHSTRGKSAYVKNPHFKKRKALIMGAAPIAKMFTRRKVQSINSTVEVKPGERKFITIDEPLPKKWVNPTINGACFDRSYSVRFNLVQRTNIFQKEVVKYAVPFYLTNNFFNSNAIVQC